MYVCICENYVYELFRLHFRVSLENETGVHDQYISNLNSILENETFRVILRNHRILSDSPDYLLRKCLLSLSRVKLLRPQTFALSFSLNVLIRLYIYS